MNCRILGIVALIISLSLTLGCKQNDNQPASTPKLSQAFQGQLLKILEAGNKLKGATEVGVNYQDYTSILNEIRGAYGLLDSMWPEDFRPEEKSALEETIAVWNWEATLWPYKIDRKLWYCDEAPISLLKTPEDFQELIAFQIVSGSKCINPDDELGKGMAYAGEKFTKASSTLSSQLD